MWTVCSLVGWVALVSLAGFGAVCLYWGLVDIFYNYWSPRQRMIRKGRK